jgi:cobalt-zinc-cadmium resistance protein CzcA
MITALIRFALTQRLLTLLLTAGTAWLGAMAFTSLPIDAFPDVSPSQVKIIIKAPGMTPEEIETRVTAPIEVELLGIPRQSTLRSMTKYALTDITVDFAQGTDIYWARQQVAERLNAVREDLPAGIEGGIAPMTTPLGEMFMFTVDGAGDLAERRALLDWTIRPALRTVPGVADVNSLGGYVRSFEVVPDPRRMAALGISIQDLEAALARNNDNDGAGRVDEGEGTLLIRSLSRVQTLDDVRQIVVGQRRSVPVTVADVADVRIGSITRYGAVTQNGTHETVQGLVLGLRGANAKSLVTGVRAKLEEIRPALPQGVSINVFYDRGTLVERAVGTVSRALLEATVLVLVLLVLFLGEVRAALVVAMVLPLAALITFVVMDQFAMSANLMSLGGLAIAIGMLVDAAVVVVENIASNLARPEAQRHPRLHVIYRAVREVSVPMSAGISIIIVVFLPLLTLEGLEGKLFSPVALTIVFALTGSLLLSLTVIPVLASMLLGPQAHAEPWLPNRLQRLYRPLLHWSLANARWPVGLALLATLAAAVVFPFIGRTFLPTMDEGDIIVQLEKLPSITLAESVHLDQRVEAAILAAVPEVTRIVARVGSDEIGMDPMGLNETDVFMVLAPRETWRMHSKAELKARIREVLEGFPGIAYGFTQPIEMRTSEMLTGVRGDVAVKIFGADLGVLSNRAEAVAATLRTISGSEDVFVSQNDGVQYLELSLNRRQLGRSGLDAQTLQRTLRAQVEGLQVGIVQEGQQRTPLVLRAGNDAQRAAERLADLPIAAMPDHYVPLHQLAAVRRVDGVVSISRESGQRFAVVRTNVAGRDLVGFVDEARRTIAEQVALPAGYYLEWGGEFENQQRAATRLTLVVPVAIALIFLLLFSTFRSIRQALLILSNIPFALIGGVFALALSGEYLSVPASVGFIALLGIAVLNGVVMVSCINQLREAGMTARKAVLEGAARRLRPVMMTASIAAIGLAPLLFAQGPGSEIQRPLAIVVIGGLISATLLTLIILPILYERFGQARGASE